MAPGHGGSNANIPSICSYLRNISFERKYVLIYFVISIFKYFEKRAMKNGKTNMSLNIFKCSN